MIPMSEVRTEKTAWRWLGFSFLIGGILDGVFGVAILVAAEPAAAWLHLTLPIPRVYFDLNGLFLVALGAIYLLIARDPRRLAPVATVATLLRFGGFALFFSDLVMGRAEDAFAWIGLMDGIFAVVHLLLLRRAAGGLLAALHREAFP